MFDPSEFDAKIRPGDDFFGFVNAAWIKRNPIPAEESRWSTFMVMRLEVEKQLQAILGELAKDPKNFRSPFAGLVRDFFATAMDAEKANRQGMEPLKPLFALIDSIRDAKDLPNVIGKLHRNGVHAWWNVYIAQDEKNTDVVAFHPFQGGLGLPDRDYYLKDDEKSKEIRAKYLAFVEAMLAKIGAPAGSARKIMELETKLAEASMTQVELRDPEPQYNKMSLAETAAAAPRVAWPSYFEGINFALPEYFIVHQPKFMEKVDQLFGATTLDDIKTYLRWCVLNSMAAYLTEELEKTSFDFYAKTFMGTAEMKPRWRRALSVMNDLLDEAVGQLYVERHFSPEAKRKVNELVDNLIVAFRARLERLDWMGLETKKKALDKLASFSRKLGYPDKWKDYAGLSLSNHSYAENYMAAYAYAFDREFKKIGKPVDRAEWYMSPQTVNACYQPTMNEILFPAAILQPPFFDPDADDGSNFGGIGSVIGHELTHGFDDQGSQFDPKGNLQRWWTDEDRKKFDEKANGLAAQFDAFEPYPGVHVNGKLTLGENIADLGGLLVAYDALQLTLKGKNGAIDGFTLGQRFFLNYAITERGHAREAYVRTMIQVDPHSPSRYRVNGPLSNIDAFCELFGIQPDDKMWREPGERVRIW